MKIKNSFLYGSAAAALLLAGSLTAGAQSFLNQFNNAGDIGGWRFDFGGTTGNTVTWNSTEGTGGAGALQLSMIFNTAQGGNNKALFTYDKYGSAVNLTGYVISFDVKVAPGSALDAFGNNGYLQTAIRNTGNYTYQDQSGLAGNVSIAPGWVHFSAVVDVGEGDQTRAFSVQNYGGPGQNINGSVTLFIDNFSVQAVPEPTTLALAGLGLAGMLVVRRRR